MTAPAVAVVGRLLRGVAALAATAAILVGAPILLWWLGGPLLPDHVPSGPEVLAALTRPDDGRLFLGALTLTGFVAWAMLASSILAEIVSLAVRRPTARIPLPGFRPSQALAATLIATILAAVASPALASPALTSFSGPQEGGAAPVVAPDGPSGHAPAHATDADRGPAGTTAAAAMGSGMSGPVRPARTYVVEQRDTLWRIAEKTLGDPRRWHEIYALNSHRAQPDGTHLTETAVLHVGWTLLLPDDAPPTDRSKHESEPRATDGTAQVVVGPGDTLTEIAAEHLGTPARYREIYETNRDRRQPDGAALHNPDLIRPGWILTMPSPTPAPPAEGPIGPGPLSPDPPSPPPPITEGVPAPPADHRTTSGSTDTSRAAAPTPGSATTTETSLPAPATGETAAPIPSSTSGTTADPAPTTSSTPAPTSTPFGRDASSRTVGAASAEAPDLAPWAAGATLSGLAAAGLITALALNRRRQHRQRPAGHRIRVPATAAGRFEWTIGQAAATADAAFLDLALRCLALPAPDPPHVGDSDAPTSGVAGIEVAAVWLHPDRLQLDLAAPCPAHPPFVPVPRTSTEPGTVPGWFLAADTPLPIAAENAFALPAPFPLLATVATVAAPPDRPGAPPATSDAAPPNLAVDHTVDTKEIGTDTADPATNDPAKIAPVDAESGDSVLLLDLEALGAVHIGGDRDRAVGLLRHIAVELAHSRWAEDVQLLLAGFPDGEIDDLVALNPERLQATGSVADAVAELWCRLGEADQAAEEPDGTYRTVLYGRLHDRPGDQWLPILLLAAEPDPADLSMLAGVCGELAGRGRSTAAVVTAAVVTPDPLPGTELVVDDHGQLHGEQLTGSTATTAPGGQLVAAHASAAAAAALVAVLHPSRQPARPVPALPHPAAWAQNMNVDGSLHTGSDPSPDLSADDPDDTTPPPAAPDGPDTPDLNDLTTSRQDPTAPDSLERDAPATAPRTRFAGDDPASSGRPVAPSETAGPVPPDAGLDAERDGSTRNGSRALPFAPAVSAAELLGHDRLVDGAPAGEHQQPVTLTDPRGSEQVAASPADEHAQQRLALVGVQDPDLDDDIARWHDQDTAPLVPMIGILGEPTVRAPGPPPPYRQPWNIEVLVYLALHPHGVSPDKARTDLWPDGRRVELNAVRHAMHGARKWAGLDRRVNPPVAFVSPVRGDGRYRVRGHLLDWELFQRLRKRAQARAGVDHTGTVADYQAALGLVRGPVLSVLREGGYAWLFNADQRHDLHIPGFIVDTAHELVDLALTAGDTATARWAADLARRLDPDATFDRPLTDLMRIAAAEDNRGELHRLGALLLDARGFDVPEELAPETFAIVDDLLPGGLTRPGHR